MLICKFEASHSRIILGEDIKGIPEFWLTILKNVPLFQEMVQEHDEPILAALQDIKVNFSPSNEPMVCHKYGAAEVLMCLKV